MAPSVSPVVLYLSSEKKITEQYQDLVVIDFINHQKVGVKLEKVASTMAATCQLLIPLSKKRSLYKTPEIEIFFQFI